MPNAQYVLLLSQVVSSGQEEVRWIRGNKIVDLIFWILKIFGKKLSCFYADVDVDIDWLTDGMKLNVCQNFKRSTFVCNR